MAYLSAPVTVDFDDLLVDALQRIQEQFPGWQPANGHLEVALLQEMVRVARETAVVAADVPDRVFERFGEELFDLPPVQARRATVTVEFEMIDDAGYAIPSGTVVGSDDGSGELVTFRTTAGLPINTGETTGTVEAEAVDVGSASNEAGPGSAVLVDALRAVLNVTFTTESEGGVDAETPEEYRNRLVDELRLQAPRAILPDDFAVIARRTPGVHRAATLDGYDPDGDTFGNERMVTVALVDDDGLPATTEARDEAVEELERLREVNFEVHTIEPTYTAVDVVYEVGLRDDAEEAETLEACDAAVERYLSPARFSGGEEDPPRWRLGSTVRRNLVIAALAGVAGVAIVEDVTLNGADDDVELSGRAPLPSPLVEPDPGDPWTAESTISGSVTS